MRSENETQSSRHLLRKWDGTKKPGPRRKRRVPWKLIAVVLVAIVAMAAMVVIKPWEGKQTEEENILVHYLASFRLLSTDNNLPIEDLLLGFDYPHLMPSADQIENADNWDEAGTIDLFIFPFYENIDVIFSGKENRPAPLFIMDVQPVIPDDATKLQLPVLVVQVSELYAGEEVRVETWLRVPKKDIEKLTLIGYWPENLARAIVDYPSPPETFGATVLVQMSAYIEQEDRPLENWTRTSHENIPNFVTIRLFKE